MPSQIAAILIFVGVFALASLRGVHLGVLMLPAACAVGVWLGGMALRDVLGGYPVGIMILLVGVTYFFGIAQVNGTIDRLIAVAVARFGNRRRCCRSCSSRSLAVWRRWGRRRPGSCWRRSACRSRAARASTAC